MNVNSQLRKGKIRVKLLHYNIRRNVLCIDMVVEGGSNRLAVECDGDK